MIQSLKEGVVTNHTEIGDLIQSFCNTNNNIELFPDHGFMDGGCLAFALSLQSWLGKGELAIVIDDDIIHQNRATVTH